MQRRPVHFGLGLGIVLALMGGLATCGRAAEGRAALSLTAGQKEFLWQEPILATVRLEGAASTGLPAEPGAIKAGGFRFEVVPAVKPRAGAKPLPLEGQEASVSASCRIYDLLEWFAFSEKGGPWTVRAVFEQNGTKLVSEPITISLRKPAKGDVEFEPMSRLHHTPWSNYDTNAFCGDTFDLVQKWPTSQFAKYCHYWNGRNLQNKKEFEKAIASYQTVVEKYPEFALADAAAYAVVECLYAQKKLAEARKVNDSLRARLEGKAAKAGVKTGTGQTTVQGLANSMAQRLKQDLGTE
jgi:hypothetical protein